MLTHQLTVTCTVYLNLKLTQMEVRLYVNKIVVVNGLVMRSLMNVVFVLRGMKTSLLIHMDYVIVKELVVCSWY